MPRPAVVRYTGLAGSLLLAVAAYRAGARSPWHPTMTPTTILHGQHGVLPPFAWVLGVLLLIGAWSVGLGCVPSARWAYLTAGLWALPLLAFLPLGSYDIYSYACQGWQQAAGLDPYAGGVDLLGCPWQDAVAPTWHASPAPYGPVFLMLAAAAAKLGGSLTGTMAGLRVVALIGVTLIGVSLPSLARRAGVPLGRAVWLALACPLVPIHLISGAHNDAVMVGLLVAGLALAVSRRPLAAGLLCGLAIGVKATAIVALPFAVLLAVRPEAGRPVLARRQAGTEAGGGRGWWPAVGMFGGSGAADAETGGRVVVHARQPDERNRAESEASDDRRALLRAAGKSEVSDDRRALLRAAGKSEASDDRRALLRAAGKLAAGALGVLLLASFLSGRGLGWVVGLLGSGVSVQWTSPSTAVGMAITLLGPDAVPVTRVVGIAVLAVVLAWFWRRARHGEPLRYVGLALAATVVLAPVFHPWYATWPLAVLAATLRRKTLWLVIPPAVAAALCLPDGYNLALATKAQGAVLMTALLAFFAVKTARFTVRTARAPSVRTPDRLDA